MRKLIFVLVLFLLPLYSNGQDVKFVLQETGYYVNPEDGKGYIVLNKEGKTKEELFKEVKMSLTKHFNSAKDVLSEVEGEQISVNALGTFNYNIHMLWFWDTNMKSNMEVNLSYKLVFLFKDNKIRVEAPQVLSIDGMTMQQYIKKAGVFKELKNKKAKKTQMELQEQLNSYFNDLYHKIFSEDEEW